jgi:hypothetical protein
MSRIALWTTYYNPNNEDRRREFLRCLKMNINNPSIKILYVLSEEADIPIQDNEKLRIISIPERPSFNTFFDNYKLYEPKSLNILLNTDIVLDYRHTTRMLDIKPNQFLALSRYEFRDSSRDLHTMEDILKTPVELFGNNGMLTSQFYYSQDTWVILGYPSVSNIFTEKLGVPHCDGRIAFRFNSLGYEVYNPCLSVFTYHIHNDKDRSYYLPCCRGSLLFTRPTCLGAILEPQIVQVRVIPKLEEDMAEKLYRGTPHEEYTNSSEPHLSQTIQRKRRLFSFLRS